MVKKVLNKKLGVEISQLGFGAMRLPTLENGKIDREQAAKMITRAYEAGVNFFDTAQPYHGGESQTFLGETLKQYPRDSYLFATKLPTWAVDSREAAEKHFNEQLANCQVDFFDFYMVHGLGEDRYDKLDKCGIYEYLTEQKKEGKIKFLGFSYHGGYDCFKRLFDNYDWDFAMIQYNYVDEIMLETGKFYDLMEQRGIPCLVMEPIRGKFLADPPEAARAEMDNFAGTKYSPAGWALRWCKDKPNVAVTLSGMSNLEQVEENIQTFANSPDKLSAEEKDMINRVRDAMLSIKTVPCTYCGYCMECPMGVNIPRIFEVYNQFKLFPNEFRAGVGYGKLVRDGMGFDKCTGCGACSPSCPQKINIPESLSARHDELEPLMQKFIASVYN
jgi:predicted aldo/keto reductase-like oxidoreductase